MLETILCITQLALSHSATVDAAPLRETRNERLAFTKPVFGGPHGKSFDDYPMVSAEHGHRRISKVTLGPCEAGKYVTYMRLDFTDWHNPTLPATYIEHGKLGWSNTAWLSLTAKQYITKVTLGVVKVDTRWSWKTRIGYIKIQSNSGDVLGCGGYQPGKEPVEWDAGAGNALLYFSGAQGDAIDNLSGHFIARKDY